MSHRQEPDLFAWVDRANASDAYLATLSKLFDPRVLEYEIVRKGTYEFLTPGNPPTARSIEDVLDVKREALGHRYVYTKIPIFVPSQNWIMDVGLTRELVKGHYRCPGCLLTIAGESSDIMPNAVILGGSQSDLSVSVKAAILGRYGQERLEMLFLALCAPDGHSRVRTGAYNMLDKFYERDVWGNQGWHAAVEMAATYHGNHEVARDLAFSWLHLHNGQAIDSIVHASPDDLIMRVEAAPVGTSIGIASTNEHVVKHMFAQSEACTLAKDKMTHMNWSVGPRARYPEDDELTREQVLATLQTPSETLLQALEAAAAPDPEWVEAEKQALEVLAALAEWGSSGTQSHDGYEQRCFLEAHAPYHVRRLHNGGVMLVAYPYRYLWPLWAKALDLLGIRKQTD